MNFPYLQDDTQDVARGISAVHRILCFDDGRKLVYHGRIGVVAG